MIKISNFYKVALLKFVIFFLKKNKKTIKSNDIFLAFVLICLISV